MKTSNPQSPTICAAPLVLAHAGLSDDRVWMALAVVCVAVVVGVLVWRSRDRKRRAHIAALEQLYANALAIASETQDLPALLDRITGTARRLLDIPMSHIVVLCEDDPKLLRRVHNHGIQGIDGAESVPLDASPGSRECLSSGQPIIKEDVDRDSTPFDPSMLKAQNIRALMLLPMIVAGKTIGLLALADSRPRRLDDEQRRLGQLIAAQAAVGIAKSQLYQGMQQAIHSHRRLQAQRDTLYTMSTAVQLATSLDEALTRIAELAPSALDIDICLVCLATDPPSEKRASANTPRAAGDWMRVAAVTPLPYPFPVEVGLKEHCPKFTKLNKTGRTIAVPDAQADPSLRERGLGAAAGIGSVLYVPLVARRPNLMGVLILMRRASGAFNDETIRMAEMFASRAAITIDNARLQEQSRRDADMKATLLHELNHRVKNNLASLIGLLSMGTPPLSAEAQRWLDRVTERISALSRTHELFTVGREVRLGELIETTLDSIVAIKPDSVHLTIDVPADADIVLSAPRAVAAAMIVYELTYNALVHGTGDSGTLDVKVRRTDLGRIEIDVIDDGGRALIGAARTSLAHKTSQSAGDFHRSGGVGLSLVRGFAARELRGTFGLHDNDRGGTTARFDFPIEPTSILGSAVAN